MVSHNGYAHAVVRPIANYFAYGDGLVQASHLFPFSAAIAAPLPELVLFGQGIL